MVIVCVLMCFDIWVSTLIIIMCTLLCILCARVLMCVCVRLPGGVYGASGFMGCLRKISVVGYMQKPKDEVRIFIYMHKIIHYSTLLLLQMFIYSFIHLFIYFIYLFYLFIFFFYVHLPRSVTGNLVSIFRQTPLFFIIIITTIIIIIYLFVGLNSCSIYLFIIFSLSLSLLP